MSGVVRIELRSPCTTTKCQGERQRGRSSDSPLRSQTCLWCSTSQGYDSNRKVHRRSKRLVATSSHQGSVPTCTTDRTRSKGARMESSSSKRRLQRALHVFPESSISSKLLPTCKPMSLQKSLKWKCSARLWMVHRRTWMKCKGNCCQGRQLRCPNSPDTEWSLILFHCAHSINGR